MRYRRGARRRLPRLRGRVVFHANARRLLPRRKTRPAARAPHELTIETIENGDCVTMRHEMNKANADLKKAGAEQTPSNCKETAAAFNRQARIFVNQFQAKRKAAARPLD